MTRWQAFRLGWSEIHLDVTTNLDDTGFQDWYERGRDWAARFKRRELLK